MQELASFEDLNYMCVDKLFGFAHNLGELSTDKSHKKLNGVWQDVHRVKITINYCDVGNDYISVSGECNDKRLALLTAVGKVLAMRKLYVDYGNFKNLIK